MLDKLGHDYLARSCRLRARHTPYKDLGLNLESFFLVKKRRPVNLTFMRYPA